MIPGAVRRLAARPRRLVGGLREAASAHETSTARVAARAGRMRLHGWRMADLAALGLLDRALRHISEPTRPYQNSYAVCCVQQKTY